jgi:hypothetical protein
MNSERKLLYLLTTGLGDYYVVASNVNDAINYLQNMLTKSDYGFSHERVVTNIKIIAWEIYNFPADKPFFSGGKDKSLLLFV